MAIALATGLVSGVSAEPVELRQGTEVGAGSGFRRGDVCTVLTAGHVVAQGGEVVVLDRTGGKGKGQVTYANPAYDIALVTLEPGFTVACNERWPDAGWMAGATWSSRSMLDALRHYPGGREAVISLRWAGGTAETLTLARVDKMEIRSSDSGSLVRSNDRPAGVIKQVDTDNDRIEVVRFDLIDRLVGERFRGASRNAPVAFQGVIYRNRAQPTWSAYVSSWLTETAGRPVVDSKDASARCSIRAEVIDWTRSRVPNAEYEKLQAELRGCSTSLLRNFMTPKFCQDSVRARLRDAPRTLDQHTVQLKVDATPRGGATQSRLRSVAVVEQPNETRRSRSDEELEAMQSSFAQVAGELFQAGACD